MCAVFGASSLDPRNTCRACFKFCGESSPPKESQLDDASRVKGCVPAVKFKLGSNPTEFVRHASEIACGVRLASPRASSAPPSITPPDLRSSHEHIKIPRNHKLVGPVLAKRSKSQPGHTSVHNLASASGGLHCSANSKA
ncbi:hypothetical protein PtA15_6A683 [Puccinia triticina]|nr:uncharacterized protein PtA15_6A683 [Puccinia triticina]WAQ86053.1 hypothetical protein PtA15_6A683 [Puccinia triticina]